MHKILCIINTYHNHLEVSKDSTLSALSRFRIGRYMSGVKGNTIPRC